MPNKPRLTHRRLALVLAALLFVLQAGLMIYATSSARLSRAPGGAEIPSFSVARFDNPAASLSAADLKTGRVVVLNFFSSWCGPCAVENPILMKLGETVPIVGIDYRDQPAAAAQYLAKHGNPYVDIGSDVSGKALAAFGFDSIPSTLIVSRAGKIVHIHRGRLREKDLDAVLLPTVARLSD